jgi:hypothetical protein
MRRQAALAAALILVTACVSGSGTSTTSTASRVSTSSSTTLGGGSGSSTTQAPPVTAPDLSGLEGLPLGMQQQLQDLIVVAQQIRGLSFLSAPKITVVSEAELEARVLESIEEVSDDFPADEALYKLLGILDPGTDLETLLHELYGEQVAGFYDGEAGEVVVPAREDGLSILQQGTMVHELTHALTDQHFGFNAKFQAMLDEERLDEATAYQALIEGDASLAEVRWVQMLSQRELGEFIAESLDIDSSSLDTAPQFIRESLIFPYDTGLGFVQDLYNSGGWEAVNEAYTLLPELPGSSEQIITPGDYQRDLPLEVDVIPVDVAGYNLERTSVWGEEGFRLILNQALGSIAGARAADGWGGDFYHQWFDGINAALLLVYKGDTAADLEELRQSMLDFALASVAEEDFVWVDEEDGFLYFIAADETSVGESIRSAVGLG